MEIRTLNLAKLALALTTVVLLGFAAAARADEGGGALTGIQQIANVAGAQPDQASGAGSTSSVPSGADPSQPSQPPPTATPEPASPSQPSQPPPAATSEPASPPQPSQPPPAAASEPASLPAPLPQASTESISQAVQEAILAASIRQPARSGSGDAGTLAAASNATTQLVWQVEISECTAHCVGITQSQTAEQQNTTLQVLKRAPPPATDHGTHAVSERSQAAVSATQIQLGCLSHCFGTTTTTGTAIGATYRRVLEELLREIAAGLPSLGPRPAAEQNTVEQTAYQSQRSPARTFVQTQSAAQTSTAVQVYDASASLVADLRAALRTPEAARDEAVSRTEQEIWQLQIGCLMYCTDTKQYQQAEQSNTAVQTVVSASGYASATTASVANVATQVIRQAQIGCLFWCFDTTEQQSVKTQNTLMVIESGQPPAPPASETTRTSSGTGAEHAPPAPSTSISSDALPSSGPSATPPTPIVPLLESVAIQSVTPTTTTGKRPVGAPRPDVVAASATAGLTARPELGARPALETLRGTVRGAAGPRATVRRSDPAAGSVAAGTALGSVERGASNLSAAVLLAAFVFCGLCVLASAVVPARRGSPAGTRGEGTGRQLKTTQQGDC